MSGDADNSDLDSKAPDDNGTEHTKIKRKRWGTIYPIEDSEYEFMLSICSGKRIAKHPKKRSLLRQIQRQRIHSRDIYHPIHQEKRPTLVTAADKIILRKSEIEGIIKMYISQCPGQGAKKLYNMMKGQFIPPSKQRIQEYLNTTLSRRVKLKAPVYLNVPRRATCDEPMEIIQADTVDISSLPTVVDDESYKRILTVICVFSRYMWCFPLKSGSAQEVASHMTTLFMEFGCPKIFQTDNGTEFGGAVDVICKEMNVQICHNRVRYPQSQGKVKSSHKAWETKLSVKIEEDPSYNWLTGLPLLVATYNRSYHRTIERTPFEAFFLRPCRFPEQFSPGGRVEETDGEEYFSHPGKLRHKETQTDDEIKAPSCNCAVQHAKSFSNFKTLMEENHKEEKEKALQDLEERVRQTTEEICQEHSTYEIKKITIKHESEVSTMKKTQWCYNCEREARYHCCWNASYCSNKCQQEHWHREHREMCRRKRNQLITK